jgi:hypothetical protein
MNDSQRSRFSRHFIIWLLAHPLPPLPVSSRLSFSVFLCVTGSAHWRERGRERSQIIRPQESQVLYRSFNNLCRHYPRKSKCKHNCNLPSRMGFVFIYCAIGGFNVSNLMGIKRRMIDIGKK